MGTKGTLLEPDLRPDLAHPINEPGQKISGVKDSGLDGMMDQEDSALPSLRHDTQRRPSRGSSGSAATLLLAANALAQTPVQSVSNALLGQVHMVAAQEQTRRNSVPGNADGQIDGAGSTSATNGTPFQHRIHSHPYQGPIAGSASAFPSSSSFNPSSSDAPPSPLSAATMQVGSIATNTAANEYVDQSDPTINNIAAPNDIQQSFFQQHLTPTYHQKIWDDDNPFQGVPSLPTTPSATLAMLPPSSDMIPGMRTPLNPDVASNNYFFQPSYRLAPEEYEILASAAAVATVALTTATSAASTQDETIPSKGPDPNGQARSPRPLNLEEQEEIASTLRAWAGLQGSEKQQEARQKLQQRQSNLKESNQVDQTQFFPPDFARHYKSQLDALATGYYHKLHSDGLTESQWAPSVAYFKESAEEQQRSSGPQESQPILRTQEQQHHQRDAQKERVQVNPLLLLETVSRAVGFNATSPQVRDQLLRYAHNLYSTASTTSRVDAKSNGVHSDNGRDIKSITKVHPTLFPLLHTLHDLHPQDLPTLLLLSCAYYSSGDLAASLWYNKVILKIDPTYVESMSNIGTTLRSLGKWKEAESWWWKAIKLRPGYWDAYENLLGVLCSPHQTNASNQQDDAATRPRFDEALRLCEYVESHVTTANEPSEDKRPRKVPGGGERPICMPSKLPIIQAPRLQNLFYAKGNLKYVIPDLGIVPAAKEYQKAVEVMLSVSEQSAYTLRDLVVATCVVGVLTMGVTLPEIVPGSNATVEIATALGLDKDNVDHAQAAASAQYTSLSSGGIMRLVRDAGDGLVNTLLRLGGGCLPVLMMRPESSLNLVSILFAESDGALPALVSSAHSQRATTSPATVEQTIKQVSSMTSTVLLTLSKLFQDYNGTASGKALTLGGIPSSTSLLLPVYYLSISLYASASTANNLGILLSSIPVVTSIVNGSGHRQQINGQTLAMQYYSYGLSIDSKHPHLYTNFGSLLKDLNHLPEAIQMYEKAIECNPDFDVALANLGNAIKDQGRTQDSIQYYRRAVKINANFPEALCGLVNAMLAVCDWKEVYKDDDEGRSGLMKRARELLEQQIQDGSSYGVKALSITAKLEDWVQLVVNSTGDSRPGYRQYLTDKLAFFYDENLDRKACSVNEGSFVIRLVERLMRRIQRRWYLDAFVNSNHLYRLQPTQEDMQRYSRIPLPSCLGPPVAPTILPFHTFTLKIPARHIRLISHRNALRISQATLNQLWLPSHVYPPPPPPKPKMKIGYISSDFNNHPLAHLMQSVFGFHDLDQFEVFLYATTASDQSPYRAKIEQEAQHFHDVTKWSNEEIINKILEDGIHILMNLNGYTKGARNEIFAARPCPVQMEFMGFAGGLASGWTDWIVVDPIVCPPEMTSTDRWRQNTVIGPTDWKGDLDPEEPSNDWIYTEKFIYMPNSYFVNDHKQGFREPEERRAMNGEGVVRPHEMNDEDAWADEEARRWEARKEMWPALPDDFVIFSCFNQLYKLEPILFKLWLRILQRVPNSILWLLRFPSAGEAHLLEYANDHFGPQVASRVVFTEVAPKGVHIHRGRIADLFLDTLECGAHTTSADCLWSGTPVLTWPKHKHKMASRVAASIVNATGLGQGMVVDSEEEYENRAVELAKGVSYTYIDHQGQPLVPTTTKGVIRANALEINKKSISATLHSNKVDTSQQPRGTMADPAPANVKQAASNSSMTSTPIHRQTVTLPTNGERAPDGTVSRRCHGSLADLRKALFLSRDQNRLFDTKRWVANLEKGYKEACNRFVDVTDT
jgi:predicted O-linked N-acetylglucosamine transferase (SPINDLY family)